MVPIPPPPLPRASAGEAAPRPAAAAPHRPPPPTSPTVRVFPAPGELTSGWRAAMIAAWAMAVWIIGAAGQAGDLLGYDAWWWSIPWIVVPFALPLLTLVWAVANHPRVVPAGVVASVITGGVAVLDIEGAPGSAAITACAAVTGLFVSLAAIAGRMPREAQRGVRRGGRGAPTGRDVTWPAAPHPSATPAPPSDAP